MMTYIILLLLTAYEYNKYNTESEQSKKKLNDELEKF